jgi:hypothetical protein
MQFFVLEETKSRQALSYQFSGENQKISWPQESGINLAMAGSWNFLLRMGASPCLVKEFDLQLPKEGDVLYVTAEDKFSSQTEQALQNWIRAGGKIVSSGCSDAWRFALQKDSILEKVTGLFNPYAGLAWIFEKEKPELIAPPKWPYLKVKKNNAHSLELIGKLAAISGERQTPERAIVTPLEDAPAILRSGNFYYFNGNPFGAFQSWLQGQEDLVPWLAWRHRIFWLDEYAAFLSKILQVYRLLPEIKNKISGLSKTTVVFRHDLDHSRDTTYLDMETQAGLSGVYPILKDGNTKFWESALKSLPRHESAFHYNTGIYSRIIEALRNTILRLPKRPYRLNRKAIQGKGLLNQVRWAKNNGVGIETLHRHLCFILYPELVDALDTVYKNEIEVLGGSSFFTGLVLRWGINEVDMMRGTYSDFTDPLFPYWFPFRLAHGGHGGRMLRGWETTSIMEPEPALVEQMLDYNFPGIEQKVIVLNYHPAHANASTFVQGGSASRFREVLELCNQKNIEVKTLTEVYQKMNSSL